MFPTVNVQGRSAGGLTMGAVLNMRPDLFNAAIMGVPFVDVVTTMMDESIPLTSIEQEEWGNPNVSALRTPHNIWYYGVHVDLPGIPLRTIFSHFIHTTYLVYAEHAITNCCVGDDGTALCTESCSDMGYLAMSLDAVAEE